MIDAGLLYRLHLSPGHEKPSKRPELLLCFMQHPLITHRQSAFYSLQTEDLICHSLYLLGKALIAAQSPLKSKRFSSFVPFCGRKSHISGLILHIFCQTSKIKGGKNALWIIGKWPTSSGMKKHNKTQEAKYSSHKP